MEKRQIGALIFAGMYSVVHYLVVAGELFKGVGLGVPPEPLATIFNISFWCSLAILAVILTPKLLRLIICICASLLRVFSFIAKLADQAGDHCRVVMIMGAEALLRGLRSLDPPTH